MQGWKGRKVKSERIHVAKVTRKALRKGRRKIRQEVVEAVEEEGEEEAVKTISPIPS